MPEELFRLRTKQLELSWTLASKAPRYIAADGGIGRSTFVVEVDGRSHLELTVEVFPSKMDYESDYLDLLRDVNSLATGLALEFLRSTFRRGAPREGLRGSAIEWLDLLTELVDELERALRQVERRPHRTLAVELAEI